MGTGCRVLGHRSMGERHSRTLAESSDIGVGCGVLGYLGIRGEGAYQNFY